MLRASSASAAAGAVLRSGADPSESVLPAPDDSPEATSPPAPEAPTAPQPPPAAANKPAGPPRYAVVPESAQWPAGPYRQAPAEHGGEWWYVSPFTGEQPWLSQGVAFEAAVAAPPTATEEFLAVFGPPPQPSATTSPAHRSTAMAQWLIDLEHFRGAGVPEGFSQEQLERAAAVYESWGLGRPVYYEGRYGWTARFPDSSIPDFEAAPFAAIETPHLVVARYQVSAAQRGEAPAQRHPFVPPQVFGDEPVSV